MPLPMITEYKEISPAELGVLERQYEKSFIAQHAPTATLKKLAIFDFDSTLFFSPLLSPTIWHPNLIRVATAESVYGPGWWRDIRSLDLGPFEELQKTAWEGYWNEQIVKEARECIRDPNTLTIVLTGRRYHPFHILIPSMLESKGLQFDLIGLRPDPESVSDNHWEANSRAELSYNLTSSVFRSTMHFKMCFILNMLQHHKTITNVVMWDDRYPHVKKFKEYLAAVKSVGTIEEGSVIYVPGVRPKYNPEWEKNVIKHIIETHNRALLEHVKHGKTNGKMKQRLEWNKKKAEDPLEDSHYLLQLSHLPAHTIISLQKELVNQLYKAFEPIFSSQLKQNRRSVWKDFGGEQAEFFGDTVYLSQNVIPSASIHVGPVGTQLNIRITDYSVHSKVAALLLKVQVEGDGENKHMLPLWYKPSEFNDLFRLKDIRWKPVKPSDRNLITSIQGQVSYDLLLGVVEKTFTTKRPLEDQYETLEPQRTRVRR